LFEKGTARLEKEMDLARIILKLRENSSKKVYKNIDESDSSSSANEIQVDTKIATVFKPLKNNKTFETDFSLSKLEVVPDFSDRKSESELGLTWLHEDNL
jgi:hypothetical protein